MKKFMELIKREDGVTAPEYALIAALVAVVIIVVRNNSGNCHTWSISVPLLLRCRNENN